MYGDVIHTQFHPGKAEEEGRIYEKMVLPAVRETKGFRGLLVLSDHSNDKGLAVALYDTEEDARLLEEGGLVTELGKRYSSVLSWRPTEELYEVVLQA